MFGTPSKLKIVFIDTVGIRIGDRSLEIEQEDMLVFPAQIAEGKGISLSRSVGLTFLHQERSSKTDSSAKR